jgi:hypothetical protein
MNHTLDDYVEVKYISEEYGYGVFAKQDIESNFIVGEYTGVISTLK